MRISRLYTYIEIYACIYVYTMNKSDGLLRSTLGAHWLGVCANSKALNAEDIKNLQDHSQYVAREPWETKLGNSVVDMHDMSEDTETWYVYQYAYKLYPYMHTCIHANMQTCIYAYIHRHTRLGVWLWTCFWTEHSLFILVERSFWSHVSNMFDPDHNIEAAT